MKAVAFIGTGNMGSALARAAAKSGKAERLLLANRSPDKALRLAGELGGEAVDNRRAAAEADALFLGVKPQMLEEMLAGIVNGEAASDSLIVSVGAGVSLFAASPEVTPEEKAYFCELLAASGELIELGEALIDAATGVTGCGPAFAAMFVEALSDGAVACGLPRAQAIRCAAQMLKGAADLLLVSGEHPGALKDRVCSPGGSTIQGVRALEEAGFRAAVMNAVIASYEKEF